jgi:hypothetical protein
VWDEVVPEADPGVAWYCVDPDVERLSLCVVDAPVELELELELEFELDELDDAPAWPATAMPVPTPRKARTLEAAAILRARPAGWRRRRRPGGVARVSGMCTSCGPLRGSSLAV